MKTSEVGIKLIKESENLELNSYRCDANKLTIGYGHVVLKDEILKKITEEQAEELLKKDVAIFEKCINENVKVPLLQHQFDALVSLVFNIGCNAFKKSTLLKRLNEAVGTFNQICNYTAANEFLRWDKVNGKVVKGLVNRRQKEKELFLKDCLPEVKE